MNATTKKGPARLTATGPLSPPTPTTLPPGGAVVKGPPFCWADKRILRRIREQCSDYGSALGVYHALTVVASDVELEEFQTTHKWLASLSGFSERTVRERLKDLLRCGVISVSTPALKAPSTFRLLPSGNGCRTSGNGCRAFGNGLTHVPPAPLPPSEVGTCKKEGESVRPTTSGGSGSRTAPPPVNGKPMATVDRITAERQRTVIKDRLEQIEPMLHYTWDRDAHPELVREAEDLRARLTEIERRILS